MIKRQCFYVPADQFDENGFIPSIVTEGEPGHAPLTGNGDHAQPWYWGKTYDEAKAVANAQNEQRFKLTEQDVLEIVSSSMAASRR